MDIQLPISALASPDSAEGRFLKAADQAGDKNEKVGVAELQSYAAAKPEQADLIGRARIADWTARIGTANPSPATPQPRDADLYTAPLGPNALGLATRYAELLKSAGLKINDVRAIRRINAGKITGARVSYETAPMNAGVTAARRSQSVSVTIFGDCIGEAARALAALRVADAVILDIPITSTYNLGRIASIRIDYCTRADYERNTTG
ncbi:MAG: hypothetical protein ACAI38_21635 [Myxococcota bacterium]